MTMPIRWRAAVLTLSDKGSRGERVDESGPLVARMLPEAYFFVAEMAVIPDERELISDTLKKWADSCQADLIITTGGTGVSPRDVTPQATLDVLDYQIPGMAEAMRAHSLKITPHAMLSRAVVGVRKNCLIINLPGSPKSARENLEVLLPALPHALKKIAGDPEDCAVRG